MRSLFSKVSVRPVATRRVASAASLLLRQRAVSSSLLRASTSRTAAASAGLYGARGFATAPKPGGGAKKPAAPAPAVPKASPAAQLQAIKTELGAILAKEASEISSEAGDDHPYAKYIKENGLTITFDQKDGIITITKSAHGYDVKAKFNATPDADENQNPYEDDGNAEGGNAAGEGKGEGQGEKEEEGDAFNYSFLLTVTPQGASSAAADSTLNLFAIASKDAKLYFEGLAIGAEKNFGEYPEIDFNDLPTSAQDKIADFMDVLKIDDEFAQFVPAAAAETSRLNHLGQLTKLAKFVSK